MSTEMSSQRQQFARVMTTAFGLFAAMVIGVVVGTVWPLAHSARMFSRTTTSSESRGRGGAQSQRTSRKPVAAARQLSFRLRRKPLRTQPQATTSAQARHCQPAGAPPSAAAKKTAQVFAYLRGKMPRAGFTGVRPDRTAPGLFHVKTASNPNAPVYFDPRNHALIIGLVVNLDKPRALIAPGTQFPAGNGAHVAH